MMVLVQAQNFVMNVNKERILKKKRRNIKTCAQAFKEFISEKTTLDYMTAQRSLAEVLKSDNGYCYSKLLMTEWS